MRVEVFPRRLRGSVQVAENLGEGIDPPVRRVLGRTAVGSDNLICAIRYSVRGGLVEGADRVLVAAVSTRQGDRP